MPGIIKNGLLTAGAAGMTLLGAGTSALAQAAEPVERPNIILMMADDMGWGDVGYNGSPIKTPALDEMAANGLQLNRFYAACPVCSPTRASMLTGRHPERYGIVFANAGHMKQEEVTLPEALKPAGYTTGHFGKWHLGTLTTTQKDGRRGGGPKAEIHYAPPWDHGFDFCFSTESAVATWDPMKTGPHPGKYWIRAGEYATENLSGDDSRVIMDRVIEFVEDAAEEEQPFLAVVWFHTPHAPVVAGDQYRAMYQEYDENKQHYYGAVTAMDEQVGRLRTRLRDLNIHENTIVVFCSDNGPAGRGGGINQEPGKRQQGSPGPYRGRKGSLYEGGVRVPGLIEWPARIRQHRATDVPMTTTDLYPTILSLLDIEPPYQPQPLDGKDMSGLLAGTMEQRGEPIAFFSMAKRAWMDDRYKIVSENRGKQYELYDLIDDPYETRDLAAEHPDKVQAMAEQLTGWIASCKNSAKGNDYVHSN